MVESVDGLVQDLLQQVLKRFPPEVGRPYNFVSVYSEGGYRVNVVVERLKGEDYEDGV